MEIAVIDNGVKQWIECGEKIAEYYGVGMEEQETCPDLGEHGSFVLSIMEKYTAKSNLYYIFNIMNRDNKGCCENVEQALRKVLETPQIKVVVMSLTAGHTARNIECLQTLCRQITEKGKIMIAADFNRKKNRRAYPASFPEVLGVGRGGFREKNAYHYRQSEIQITGDVLPEWVYAGNGRYRLFGGTSKAAPKMLFHVERALEAGAANSYGVESYLREHSMAGAENILPEIEKKQYCLLRKKDKMAYKTISKYLSGASMVDRKMLQAKKDRNFFLTEILTQSSDLDLLLRYLFKNMDVKIDFQSLHFFDYGTIYDLAGWMGNYL